MPGLAHPRMTIACLGDKQLLMASAHAHAGREGTILDVVHKHKPSALDFAIVSSRDKDIWPEGVQEVVGDDVIHVLPKKLDPAAEVRDRLGAGWGGKSGWAGKTMQMSWTSQPCVRGWLRAGWKGMQEQRRLATVKGGWTLFTASPPLPVGPPVPQARPDLLLYHQVSQAPSHSPRPSLCRRSCWLPRRPSSQVRPTT